MAIWYYANIYWWCEIVYALAKMSQLNMIGHLQSTRRASKYFIHLLWFVLVWNTFHCCQCLLWYWLFTSFKYCCVPSHISFNLYSQPLFNFKSVSAYTRTSTHTHSCMYRNTLIKILVIYLNWDKETKGKFYNGAQKAY